MSFLSPLFLAGALAVAVPIVLHFLRRQPEARVKFAAVHMLQHAPVEHADRRKLRQLLLLALRCLAVLLLAIAFARPFLVTGGAAAATGVTVVALDTSLSMSAPGRFARAQQLARQAIADAPASHLVGVLTFDDAARVVAAASGDRAAAATAVDGARAGVGATRYRAALAAATDAMGGRPGQAVVVTDLQASGWDTGDRVGVPESVQVIPVDVGEPVPNLAVIGARRGENGIVATIRNAGSAAREARLRLVIDGAPSAEATVAVGANQSTDVVFPGARGEAAEIAVEDADGTQGDNVRYLVLSGSSRPSILLVTSLGDLPRDAFYAQSAFEAAGADGASFDVAGVSGERLSGWDAAMLARHAVVVLLSTRGLNQRGRELVAAFVTGGGGLLVAAGPDVDSDVAAGALAGAIEVTPLPPAPGGTSVPRTLAPGDVRHPMFRAFAADAATLGLVTFRQIVGVRGTGCEAAARFSTGEPAVLDCPLGMGRAIVVASDLDGRWNDFPLHTTFLPFLHQSAEYLAGPRRLSASFTVGAVPPGGPALPGFGTLAGAPGLPSRRIAVNVEARESDPARVTPDEFRLAVTPVQSAAVAEPMLGARQQEERQNLWRYAILVVLAALVGESLLAARTA